MNNLFFGILVVLICVVGYYRSWQMQAKDNFGAALLLLVLCGFVLRMYTASDLFLHEWDERYHALVAKNLLKHPLVPTLYDNPLLPYDYREWGSNHIWVHKQPLPLWTMALSLKLFGINEIALRLPSVLLTTIGIALTFSIAACFFNRRVAWLAAFLFSINGLVIEIAAGRTATDHIDVFFLFFVELAVFFTILFIRKQQWVYNLLAGLSIGAAILSKWLPALIVLPVWLLLVADSGKFSKKEMALQFILLCMVCTAVFLPWQLYIFSAFPAEAQWESEYNFKHITESLGHQDAPFYYFFSQMRINYGELIYLPLGWLIWKLVKQPRDYKRLALFTWIIIPFLFFSFVRTKMQAYTLFTCPALFIITAGFWYMLLEYREGRKPRWLYNLVLFLLIALPIRYTIERAKPFNIMERHPQWVKDLKKLDKRNIQKGVLLNYPRPVEAMFYTDLTAYPYLPGGRVIDSLVENGYHVLVNAVESPSPRVERVDLQ